MLVILLKIIRVKIESAQPASAKDKKQNKKKDKKVKSAKSEKSGKKGKKQDDTAKGKTPRGISLSIQLIINFPYIRILLYILHLSFPIFQ